ncbi:MAG: c-type cytochrome [Alphaproteobacteria bacterium]
MKFHLAILAVLATAAAPAFAAGDAAKGEAVFKQCQTCHMVADPTGKVIAGKGAKIGPNLYSIIGRPAASYPEFKYGAGITAAGAAGLIWDEEKIATYLMDPTKYLDEFTGDPTLKSKMAFKLKKAEDGANVAAYLASLSPATPPAN